MRKLSCLALALAMLAGCVTQSSSPESEAPPTVIVSEAPVEVTVRTEIGANGMLKAQGKNLYTAAGELINLRGVNIGGWLLQEFWMTSTAQSSNVHAEYDIYEVLTERFGEDKMLELVRLYQSSYFTEDDFDRLQAMGINCLRLPFWYRNIVDADGVLYSDWFGTFDWFVEQAGKRGMYVILDMHGAPGSQSGSDHSGVDGGDNKEEASKFFFGDEAQVNQQLFYFIWETVAERYRGNPVVAGYDLINEPYCTYRYSTGRSVSELHKLLWDIYDEAYRKIRAVDPDHIVIMEATWDPSDLPDPSKYGWENVMYQYHNYLYDDYTNANGQQIANMEKKLNLIKKANYNVPSLMGEFSYFNRAETWDEGLKLLNAAGLNWTMWTYKVTGSNGNWGLFHQKDAKVNVETADEERIRERWSAVGNAYENSTLCAVVKKYVNAPFIESK